MCRKPQAQMKFVLFNQDSTTIRIQFEEYLQKVKMGKNNPLEKKKIKLKLHPQICCLKKNILLIKSILLRNQFEKLQ